MTRTSATGARSGRSGFTLVEMMVVLVVLGLMAAVVVVAIPDGRMTVAAEGERFAARLKRAQEEAVLVNRPVQVELTAGGYAFRVRDAGGWRALDDGPFRPEAWAPRTRATSEKDVRRIAFDPTGIATPAHITLSRGDRAVEVAVDQAGNVRIDAL
ncbi:MAG: type II secretion system protein GspH [Caulobacter sp.]|nr:type II secretion system protein GspH [Caulobacter sp.]